MGYDGRSSKARLQSAMGGNNSSKYQVPEPTAVRTPRDTSKSNVPVRRGPVIVNLAYDASTDGDIQGNSKCRLQVLLSRGSGVHA